MKIAIVVQGRFHAFDLACALLERGHQVVLFTDYPLWAVRRFNVPGEVVRSFWLHGVAAWAARLLRTAGLPYPDPWLLPWFSRWAAARLRREEWDVIHCWSGAAKEIYEDPRIRCRAKLLMRGSAHIRTQEKILREEQVRTGSSVECPTRWMVEREEAEYRLADRVVVLSEFARRSFAEEGLSGKVKQVPIGTQPGSFKADPDAVESRCRRILSGEPLRVLYVGAISFRKGLWDIAAILRDAGSDGFRFRLVGPVPREAKRFLRRIRGQAEIHPKQPQGKLPEFYRWADIFLFPTIEDGFAIVLAQAVAGAVPVLATTNCAGPDLIEDGKTGWVLPIRSPQLFADRLRWCRSHRRELADMVRRIAGAHPLPDYSRGVILFEEAAREVMGEGSAAQAP